MALLFRWPMEWPVKVKEGLVATFMVLSCWVFFEGVRRTKATRFLFGIKQ